jgi:hypothetical protein
MPTRARARAGPCTPSAHTAPERNSAPISLPMVGGGTLMTSVRFGWARESAPPVLTTSSMVYLITIVSSFR